MLHHPNATVSRTSHNKLDFLRFFNGLDSVGQAITKSLKDQDLRNLRLTSKDVLQFLKPLRVPFLMKCENITSSDVKSYREQSASLFVFRLMGLLIFGSMGAAQLYRYAFRIIPGLYVSDFKPAESMLFLCVCSVALVQNGYYVYKYAALPFLNYINNYNKEVKLEGIQNRIKSLAAPDDVVQGQMKLKKD